MHFCCLCLTLYFMQFPTLFILSKSFRLYASPSLSLHVYDDVVQNCWYSALCCSLMSLPLPLSLSCAVARHFLFAQPTERRQTEAAGWEGRQYACSCRLAYCWLADFVHIYVIYSYDIYCEAKTFPHFLRAARSNVQMFDPNEKHSLDHSTISQEWIYTGRVQFT